MLDWFKVIFKTKSAPALLDDHVASVEEESLRAFHSDDVPYRTTKAILEERPVDEEALLETELKLKEWLFRNFAQEETTYVVAGETLDIAPDEKRDFMLQCNRTMRLSRLVIFSKQLSDCKVTMFRVGVEQMGEFINTEMDASAFRMLTYDPIKYSEMLLPGMGAYVNIRNAGLIPANVTCALLGEVFRPESSSERLHGAVQPQQDILNDLSGRLRQSTTVPSPPSISRRISNLTGSDAARRRPNRRSDSNEPGDV